MQSVCLFKKLRKAEVYTPLCEKKVFHRTLEKTFSSVCFSLSHSDKFDHAAGLLVLARVLIKSQVETTLSE